MVSSRKGDFWCILNKFSSNQSTGIISFRKWSKESQIINKILRSSRRGYPYIQSTIWSCIKKNLKFLSNLVLGFIYFSKYLFESFQSQQLLLDIRMAPLAASQVICFHQWFLEIFRFSLLNAKIKRNEVWVEWREKFLMKNVIRCQIL